MIFLMQRLKTGVFCIFDGFEAYCLVGRRIQAHWSEEAPTLSQRVGRGKIFSSSSHVLYCCLHQRSRLCSCSGYQSHGKSPYGRCLPEDAATLSLELALSDSARRATHSSAFRHLARLLRNECSCRTSGTDLSAYLCTATTCREAEEISHRKVQRR